MTLQNLHTHTCWGDGGSTAEEMALGAISSGCTSLGFSEHSPLPWGTDGWAMAEADTAAYRAEILRLKKRYAGRLEIFLGLEQDMDSPLTQGPWDYRIGSVHSLWGGGVYLSVDRSPSGSTSPATPTPTPPPTFSGWPPGRKLSAAPSQVILT